MLLNALSVIGVLGLSVAIAAASEVFWHKFLFHRRQDGINRFLARLWGYDVAAHREHHRVSRASLEDPETPLEEYWVQTPSNVGLAWLLACLVECTILRLVGVRVGWMFLGVTLLLALFVFWYRFEDHFHAGMHKSEYFNARIRGRFYERWFDYCKSMHALHHTDASCNYGFIFFPIGDLVVGTFRSAAKERQRRSVRLESE